MVARTTKVNAQVRNVNELEPGSWIYIPAVRLPDSSAYEVVRGEIIKTTRTARSRAAEPKAEAPVPSVVPLPESASPPPPPRPPADGPRQQIVRVQCPDESIREAHVRLVLPKSAGDSALLVVLDKEGICAVQPGPGVAEVADPKVEPKIDTKAAEEKVKPEVDEGPVPETKSPPPKSGARNESPVPGKLEEVRPASVAATQASRDISQLPFFVSPLLGYVNDTFQFGGAMGSPNTGGLTYGARAGYVYRTGDWGYLIDLSYRLGQLTTSEPSADYITMTALEYGLGVSYRHWTVRAGFANDSLTDASSGANVGFADKGYYGSLAYSFFFNARTSCSIEGRYVGVTYMRSNNGSLPGDTASTQLEALLSLDYRFGLW